MEAFREADGLAGSCSPARTLTGEVTCSEGREMALCPPLADGMDPQDGLHLPLRILHDEQLVDDVVPHGLLVNREVAECVAAIQPGLRERGPWRLSESLHLGRLRPLPKAGGGRGQGFTWLGEGATPPGEVQCGRRRADGWNPAIAKVGGDMTSDASMAMMGQVEGRRAGACGTGSCPQQSSSGPWCLVIRDC